MRPPASLLRLPAPLSRPRSLPNVCWPCPRRRRLIGHDVPARSFARASAPRPSAPPHSVAPPLSAAYFLSNSHLVRFNGGVASHQGASTAAPASSEPQRPGKDSVPSPTLSFTASAPPVDAHHANAHHANAHLPHRRRQAERRAAAAAAAHAQSTAAAAPSSASDTDAAAATATVSAGGPPSTSLPPDASSLLAHLAARQPPASLRRRLSALLSLAKPRLTVLVVLSAMASYALYPVPAFLSPTALADAAPSLSPLTLLFLTTGTTLCSAAANALNMLYEPDTDARMSRTRARPLVRGLVSRRAAALFALACAALGLAALGAGVNPTVAALGLANVLLYAGVYTPLKRLSWLNTWVGAVVGGIPPLMGWAAAAGESATGDGGYRELLFSFPALSSWWGAAMGDADDEHDRDRDHAAAATPSSTGGWLLAGILFAWQFPHFMALSWPVRAEYRAAGLRMLCWLDAARNARVALRYAALLPLLCVGLCAAGVTEWSFAATSLPVNAWLVREAVRFWRRRGEGGSARGLFWASVWYIPVVMVLALVQKKGMWARVWRSVAGEEAVDEEEEEEEWDEEWEEEQEKEGEAIAPRARHGRPG